MPSLSVFGAQWGDEGKGKVIDLLASGVDLVVRYQGGANAGHTVVVGDQKYALHLIPSGILHPEKLNVVANGVAIDPGTLLSEIEGLRARGVSVGPENLLVSARAQVIFQHHKRIDALGERWLGEGKIGTTGRGMGPCYADKAARTGLRICDLLDPDVCRQRLRAALAEKNALIEKVHGEARIDLDEELTRSIEHGRALMPYVGDAGEVVRSAYRDGKRVLFEGAQGFLLDIDHGTYPFVTSSNTGVGGIPSGAAFPPRWIDRSVGIAKAYCTRVGEGPFPTELNDEFGDTLRRNGKEFGTTTGRPRRAGWFDAPAVRHALEVAGADGWVMTKLDVLTGLDTLSVGVGYQVAGSQGAAGGRGERRSAWPAELISVDGLEVVWESFPGWSEDISDVRRFEDLPKNARDYVVALEGLVGAPVLMVSVGPERDAVIDRGL